MDSNQTERLPRLDRYPDPAASYALAGDGPVIQAANDEFESAFGTAAEGTPLAAALGAVEIDDLPDVTEGGPFTVETAGEGLPSQYHGRVVPPADSAPGYLLFVESASSETLGVDRVASVISHDLRNPLDVAKTRLRAGRELDSAEHFEHVEQAHDRMERIIEDVLTLARGEDVIDPEGTEALDEIAREAWQTVDTEHAKLDIEGQLPTATADRDRVSRLFENLFRNAVEHGGRDARICVGPLADARGFYVADDGPGISEEHRDLVFQPGYSSDDHGTGLGLAIVEQIADVHGWTVSVTDAASGGARFEIRGVSGSE
jgi:signal transduction histidine kinase